MKIILPFRNPEDYPLTQKFGVTFMYGGEKCKHKGIDYALPNGTNIIAPFDGIVVRTTPERNYGYGKAIYLEATDESRGKVVALMAHCSEISVKTGFNLKKGQGLGLSGRSGFWRGKNGYHIHFGIKVGANYIDPLTFMSKEVEQDSSLFDDDDSKLKSWLGEYTVKPGDSLWRISQKFYKNGGHFIDIYAVNMDQLNNPNLIHPGTILRIPAINDKGI